MRFDASSDTFYFAGENPVIALGGVMTTEAGQFQIAGDIMTTEAQQYAIAGDMMGFTPPRDSSYASMVGMTTEAQQYAIAGLTTQADQYQIGAARAQRVFTFRAPGGYRADGKVKFWRKGNKLCGCLCMKSQYGKLYIMACTSLEHARKMAALATAELGAEFGWNPFKSIAKAGRNLGSTVSNFAKKKVARNLVKVVNSPKFQRIAMAAAFPAIEMNRQILRGLKNPQVQKIAMAAAPIAGAAFGVPPHITAMATGVLSQAMQKQPGAMDKVRNISALAAQQYPPAMRLQQTMSMLYRGGMQQLGPQGVAPYVPSYSYGMMQQPPMYQPQMYPGMPPQQMMQQPMFPMQFQGVSGWLYNLPYRSPLEAKALDKGNPFHLARAVYHQGMQ